jgi:hypothetical protein
MQIPSTLVSRFRVHRATTVEHGPFLGVLNFRTIRLFHGTFQRGVGSEEGNIFEDP